MEPVDGCHVTMTLITTDIDAGRIDMAVNVKMFGGCGMRTSHLAVFDGGELVAEISDEIPEDVWNISLPLPIQQMTLWSPDNPKLYNYTLKVKDENMSNHILWKKHKDFRT